MLDPPFLELQYYVPDASLGAAVAHLVDGLAPGVLPRKLVIPDLVGISQNAEELEVVRSVIVLRTEGEMFCGSNRSERTRLRALGRRVYERFVQVANVVACAYGAILVEYSLEEPEVLRQDPRSLGFRDFFLSAEHFNAEAVNAIVRLAGDAAYVERLNRGVYVSTSGEFNPEGKTLPSDDALERSVRIATVVGQAIR
jgi:hypothetical protein